MVHQNVDARLRRFVEPTGADWAGDTDDFVRLLLRIGEILREKFDGFADGIFVRPISPRELTVDYHCTRFSRSVLLEKRAALEDLNFHHRQVVRGNHGDVGSLFDSRLRGASLDSEPHLIDLCSERNGKHRDCGCYAGNLFDTFDSTLHELSRLRGIRILGGWKRDSGSDEIRGIEP